MPREILYNESPTGLRGGDLSGPQQIWHASVRQYQRDEVEPILDRVLEVYFASRGIPAWRWSIEWPDLWSPDEESEAGTYKQRAEADQTYVALGVVTPDELRAARFEDEASGGVQLEPRAAPEEGDDVAAASPEDEAMNGAQISSMVEIMRAYNAGEMTYRQALGVLGTAFPRLAGREADVLGPEPEEGTDDGGPKAEAPSLLPQPDDVIGVREAAARFGLPTRTLTLAMERGQLPYWQFGGRRVVSLTAVEALGRETGSGAPPTPAPPEPEPEPEPEPG
jgi:hypothetical protein